MCTHHSLLLIWITRWRKTETTQSSESRTWWCLRTTILDTWGMTSRETESLSLIKRSSQPSVRSSLRNLHLRREVFLQALQKLVSVLSDTKPEIRRSRRWRKMWILLIFWRVVARGWVTASKEVQEEWKNELRVSRDCQGEGRDRNQNRRNSTRSIGTVSVQTREHHLLHFGSRSRLKCSGSQTQRLLISFLAHKLLVSMRVWRWSSQQRDTRLLT